MFQTKSAFSFFGILMGLLMCEIYLFFKKKQKKPLPTNPIAIKLFDLPWILMSLLKIDIFVGDWTVMLSQKSATILRMTSESDYVSA